MEETQHKNRQIAASLLAYSISNIFPKAEIVRMGPTKKGFFCDCRFPSNADTQALVLIQEELQRLIIDEIEIESVEMMKENAANLFHHQGFYAFERQALEAEINIVELVRIGNFYVMCPGPHPKTTKELGVVKLWLACSGSISRIEGIACSDRRKLKSYLKILSAFRNHEEIGRELKLFSIKDNRLIWEPRGEWVRELLVDFWRSSHRELGYEVFSRSSAFSKSCNPPFSIGDRLSEIIEKKRVDCYEPEGLLFDLESFTSDSVWAVMDEEEVVEKLISYLHFIIRTVKMMPIECVWVFNKGDKNQYKNSSLRELSGRFFHQALQKCGLKPDVLLQEKGTSTFLEARYIDSLERAWLGPKIQLRDSEKYGFKPKRAKLIMEGSLFRSLETLIAILLEATNGSLPLWLAPEQVRVLPVGSFDEEYSRQLVIKLRNLAMRAHCDSRSLSLSERVYLARKLQIPFVVIIGEYERRLGTVALKCQGEGENTKQLSIDEFVEKVHEQNKQI